MTPITSHKTSTVSVIMPVYNAKEYIGKAIESILNQTYENFEFIIFDDASTDGTCELIQAFNDPRINLIQKPKNTGYIDSLNMGLAIAKGKYIARMDADDISLPTRFETQIAILEGDEQIGVCCSNYQVINENGRLNPCKNWQHNDLPVFWELLWENPVAHPTVIMRADVLRQHQFRYNKKTHPAEDYDLWCKMCLVTKFYRTEEVLLYYRVHSASEFQKNKDAAFQNGLKSLQELAVQLCGYPFPDMHIQQTVFHTVFKKQDITDPEKYYTWLNELLQLVIEKGFVASKDRAVIANQIKAKCTHLVKEYWLNVQKFSIKKMFEFYFSPVRPFLKFGLGFQCRLVGKCLIGYAPEKRSKTKISNAG